MTKILTYGCFLNLPNIAGQSMLCSLCIPQSNYCRSNCEMTLFCLPKILCKIFYIYYAEKVRTTFVTNLLNKSDSKWIRKPITIIFGQVISFKRTVEKNLLFKYKQKKGRRKEDKILFIVHVDVFNYNIKGEKHLI